MSGDAVRTVKENPMKKIEIGKVVVNIGVGEAGEKLSKAEQVLVLLTGQKPSQTISKTTNRDLGIRKGMPIGCRITLRGEKVQDFLKRAFWVKSNKIMSYSFDPGGNFSFGISDYTDFKGMRYNPDIGIFGMDISVILSRPGNRVMCRKRAKGRVSRSHRVTPNEAKQFVRERFNVEVVEG